jgi:hypothetical protein
MFFDHAQRAFFLRQAEAMVAEAEALPQGSVMLTGYSWPYGAGLAAAEGREDAAARIVDGLPPDEVRARLAAGGSVYYLPSALPELRGRWGLDPGALGLKPAPIAPGR